MGPVFQLIDSVLDFILGFSPAEEWVVKPLLGDWEDLAGGASAWRASGAAADAIAAQLVCAADAAAADWTGQTSDAFQRQLKEFAEALSEYPDGAEMMAVTLDHVLAAAQAAKDVVVAAIEYVGIVAELIIAELCIPVAGPPAAGATAAANAAGITLTCTRVAQSLKKVEKAIKLINKVAKALQKLLDMLKGRAAAIEAGRGAAGSAGQAIDWAGGMAGRFG
jgi:uncharacterized protein YukE